MSLDKYTLELLAEHHMLTDDIENIREYLNKVIEERRERKDKLAQRRRESEISPEDYEKAGRRHHYDTVHDLMLDLDISEDEYDREERHHHDKVHDISQEEYDRRHHYDTVHDLMLDSDIPSSEYDKAAEGRRSLRQSRLR